MSGWGVRLLVVGLMILLGILVGGWGATSYFRSLLEHQQNVAAHCAAARDNLAALTTEQGKALRDLTLAADERQAKAEQAMKDAQDGAQANYAAANRLQQERTAGDQCSAADSIIDKELNI